MSDLTLHIAGIRIRLRAPASQLGRARRRYAPYVTSGRADIVIDWETGDPPKTRYWPEPRVIRSGRGRFSFSRRDFYGEVNGRKGKFITSGDRVLRPLALDSSLRVLLSELLAQGGGMLVHSAAIDGWMFPGPTMAGKSTLARLAPRKRVLTDELVAVTPGFTLRATPFWGSFVRGTSTRSHPMRALFFLRRRKREAIQPITPSVAASRLLECALCFSDEEDGSRRLLRSAVKIVRAVPCFWLSYDVKKTGFRELEKRLVEALHQKPGSPR